MIDGSNLPRELALQHGEHGSDYGFVRLLESNAKDRDNSRYKKDISHADI